MQQQLTNSLGRKKQCKEGNLRNCIKAQRYLMRETTASTTENRHQKGGGFKLPVSAILAALPLKLKLSGSRQEERKRQPRLIRNASLFPWKLATKNTIYLYCRRLLTDHPSWVDGSCRRQHSTYYTGLGKNWKTLYLKTCTVKHNGTHTAGSLSLTPTAWENQEYSSANCLPYLLMSHREGAARSAWNEYRGPQFP